MARKRKTDLPSTNPEGKPPWLDDEDKRNAFLDAVEAGNYLKDAAAEADVDESAVFRALRKGKQPDAPEKYRQFVQEVRRRRKLARSRLIGILANAAQDDPQYAVVLLKAFDPERFSPDVNRQVREQLSAFAKRLSAVLPAPFVSWLLRVGLGMEAGTRPPLDGAGAGAALGSSSGEEAGAAGAVLAGRVVRTEAAPDDG